jgi:RimJ/RimL family protein N-acetyltransferase
VTVQGLEPTLRTDRLLLRPWRATDLEPFAALNADPAVMQHFRAPLTRAESDAMVDRIERGFATNGFGLWAVEITDEADFIGFIGLARHTFPAHFTPAIEVGWRLGHEHWGRGFAPEGARVALAYGFEQAGLDEIVSMTTVGNTNSRRVMEKIGMARNPADDFDHPKVPAGSPLRPHVLYRLAHRDWFPSPPLRSCADTPVAARGSAQDRRSMVDPSAQN